MTIPRKKKTTPLEDFASIVPPIEESFQEASSEKDLEVSKLDLFALFASIGVAKKMDDPAQIAHESYQIGFKMMELSEVYKDWKK